MRFVAALFGLVAYCAAAFADTTPTSDDIAAAQALIRWYFSEQSPEHAKERKLYVSVGGVDLPPEAVRELRDTGMQFLPIGEFKPSGPQGRLGNNLRLMIGKFERRSDGDFEVTWSYYCGRLCGTSNMAVLRHDASGWHVIRSEERWVS